MINEVLKNSKEKDLGLQCKDCIEQIPNCKVCGEPTGILVKTAFGYILGPRACKCKRDRLALAEKEEKNKEKQIRLQQVLKNSMINDKFKTWTLKNWNHEIGNENLYRIAKNYIDTFPKRKKRNQGLLFYGDPGNGKTYCSATIANALLDKLVPVICIGAIALLERISQSKRNWGDEGIFKVLNSLENADLLVIDDLGTEPDNNWSRSMIYQIIEKRSGTGLPVIITTNISMNELKERYDYRTYSRLTEMCCFIRNTGMDIRKIQGKKKTGNLLKELLV